MKTQLTILIVDDVVIDRSILKAIFEKDYQVLEANNGLEAIERLQGDQKVDIILLDIVMPKMNGLEFLTVIRENPDFREIPVIVNTQVGEQDTELRALELGADDFILKPYNPKIVKRRIDNIVEKFIYQRENFENTIKMTNDRLATLIDAVPGGIGVFQVEDKIRPLYVNDGLCAMLRYERRELEKPGRDDIISFVYEKDRPIVRELLKRNRESSQIIHCKVRLICQDGAVIWVGISSKRMEAERTARVFYAVFMDLTEEKQAEDQLHASLNELRFRVERDALTGLYNRATFYRETEKMMSRNPEVVYVIGQWNIDRFKVVNELFGSKTGDRILVGFAEYFRDILKGKATYGRLEADHFVFCVPLKFVDASMQKIERVLAGEGPWNDLNYPILSHVGLYLVEDTHIPVDLMCDRANMALQIIKNNYMKRWTYYDEMLKDAILTEQELVNEMQTALDEKQFAVYYQPIINVDCLEPVSAEALVRWIHPKKGLISPAMFIPLFEKNGFILKLDMYVCEEVCRYIANRLAQGRRVVPISVNLSRISFYHADLCKEIMMLINKYKINSSYLKIEITESAYTDNPKDLVNAMTAFQRNGLKVLMDDFGSGYSSLNMLKDVSVDILKIDMKFMDNLETSERAGNILFSIIQMAKSIQMEVVAEGVETESQFELLASMGCDSIQGYYFSKPLPEHAFSERMDCIEEHPACEKPDTRKQTILVVDDIEVNRVSIAECIKDSYQVLEACDGAEAINILKGDFANISLVISDIFMPNKNGLELLAEMNKNLFLKKIPVLMVTAYGESENEIRALELGALDVITKPYDPDILKKRIENLLRISENRNIEVEVKNLREAATLRKQAQTLLRNNICGICRVIIDNPEDMEVQQCMFINERFEYLHDRPYTNMTETISLIDYTGNIVKEDRHYIEMTFREALKRRETIWQCAYRIQWESGTTKNILSTCAMDYTDHGILIDFMDIEVVSPDGFLFEKALQELSCLISSNTDMGLWIYNLEQDSFEYTKCLANGKIYHCLTENGRAHITTSKRFLEQDRNRLNHIFDRLARGEDFIREEFLIRMEAEEAERGPFKRYRLTYQKLENEKNGGRVAVGILENIDEQAERAKKNWREKQYKQILAIDSLIFAEVDLTANRLLNKNKFYGNEEEGVLSYDAFLCDMTERTICERDAPSCKKIMNRQKLLEAYAFGKRKIKFECRLAEAGSDNLEWYISKFYMTRSADNGHILGSWQIKSVQEEKDKVNLIRTLAEHDALTSLLNRVTFEHIINSAFMAETAILSPMAFIMVDIDNFKAVNDNFGHNFGDDVLKAVAKLLLDTFRKEDVVCRLGGDEFAVFIPHTSSREGILKHVWELCSNANTRFDNSGVNVNISCSAGVAFGPEHGADFQELYTHADEALYYAKKHGKNRVAVYGEDSGDKNKEE